MSLSRTLLKGGVRIGKAAASAAFATSKDTEQTDAADGRHRWAGVLVLAGAAMFFTLFLFHWLAVPLAWTAGLTLALRWPRSRGLTLSTGTFYRELARHRALAIILGAGGTLGLILRATVDEASPLLGLAGIVAIMVLNGTVAAGWTSRTLRQMALREKYGHILSAVLQVPATALEHSILDDRKKGEFHIVPTPPGAALRLDSLEERLALAWPEWAVDEARTSHASLVLVEAGADAVERRELLRETDGMIEGIVRHTRPAERTVAVAAGFTGTVAELAKAHRGIVRALGEGWQIEEVDGNELHLAADPDPRPSAETWTLPAGVSPTAGARYAALAESRGATLVEWAPYDRQAFVARITPAAKTLRDRIAPDLKAEPWDVEIRLKYGATEAGDGYVAGVDVLRGRRHVTDPKRRRDEWMSLIATMCPTPADYLWTYREDGLTGAISFRCIADPLEGIVPFTVDPTQSVTADEPWHVGRDENGDPVLVDLAASAHMLVAGTTRSGKSVGTYSLLTHVLRMGDSARLLVADPNDTTIAPFEDKVSWSTSSTDPEPVTEMLRWVRAEMDRRKPILRAMRRDKIEAFSPELPLIVVVIDEAANYMNHSDTKAAGEMAVELKAVVAQAAKFGVRVVLITQSPDSKVLDTTTRSLLSARICFRVDDLARAQMAFPDIEDPEILLDCKPGVGLVKQVGGQALRFRSVYLKDHWDVAARLPQSMPKVNVRDLGGVVLRPAVQDLTKQQIEDMGTLELSADDLVEDLGELSFDFEDDEDAA
ncbi:FtsK/SpoIIIE domain-containing protein [Sinomonas sp. RB5]